MTNNALPPESSGGEPMFNAPVSAFIIPGLIVLLAAGQFFLAPEMSEQLIAAFGLNPILVRSGHFELLFTYSFLHGSFVAAILNALFVFAFSVPLLRALGGGVSGFVSYISLFLLCSVAAGLAYCLVHMFDNYTVVGASVIMSGLFGAAARFPGFRAGEGRLIGLFSPQVAVLTLVWTGFNLFNTVANRFLGLPAGDMAWESHMAAYLIGLVLIEPWLRLFCPRYFTNN